jgi:acetyltransferase
MSKLIAFLTGRGTQRVVGIVLKENRGMRELAHALGFRAEPAAPGDADTLNFVLPLPAALREPVVVAAG